MLFFSVRNAVGFFILSYTASGALAKSYVRKTRRSNGPGQGSAQLPPRGSEQHARAYAQGVIGWCRNWCQHGVPPGNNFPNVGWAGPHPLGSEGYNNCMALCHGSFYDSYERSTGIRPSLGRSS